jgi:hypothetical protein
MLRLVSLAALLLVAACSPAERPEVACQKRVVAVRAQPDEPAETGAVSADPFHAQGYAALDLTGCTPEQRSKVARLTDLAKRLPRLMEANERAPATGNDSAHMAAFQAMNDALIALDDLEQGAAADLERMLAEPAA